MNLHLLPLVLHLHQTSLPQLTLWAFLRSNSWTSVKSTGANWTHLRRGFTTDGSALFCNISVISLKTLKHMWWFLYWFYSTPQEDKTTAIPTGSSESRRKFWPYCRSIWYQGSTLGCSQSMILASSWRAYKAWSHFFPSCMIELFKKIFNLNITFNVTLQYRI